MDTCESDLPLSANYEDVSVEHFILDLVCDMNANVFDGSITLFLKDSKSTGKGHLIRDGSNSNKEKEKSHLKLDCFGLDIKYCSCFELSGAELHQMLSPIDDLKLSESVVDNKEIQIPHSRLKHYWDLYSKEKKEELALSFEKGKHWIGVNIPNLSSWDILVVTINFCTSPNGPSLMWTRDQHGRDCVFTIGDAFNNRSLFPSQDMPQAMASWHCSITLVESDDMTVLMTGEEEPIIQQKDDGLKVFHYYSSYRMPASTFALAVGSWSSHIVALNHFDINSSPSHSDATTTNITHPRCRIHCPQNLLSICVKLFSKYLPRCFNAVASVLEPYPLKRLDILIAPDCFDSLGLASPNLLILSQSVLTSDLSLFYRVSHELCHTWFGILSGPRNWTEDWLTEGMCCYLEDIVHAKSMQWTDKEIAERNQLKSFLKFKLLESEVEYIPDSLQRLRPDGNLSDQDMHQQTCVRNGIRSETAHIHYMKGFFLLKHLENSAGNMDFLSAIRKFVKKFKGKLFTSQDLLDHFFLHCPQLKQSELDVSTLSHEWLDATGIPKSLKEFPHDLKENQLYLKVTREFESLKLMCGKRKRKAGTTQHSDHEQLSWMPDLLNSIQDFGPEQTVLFLTLVLEVPELKFPQNIFPQIKTRCNISQSNAEVQHVWCELVLQRKLKSLYKDVEVFLLEHRSMGLYLYGELMISEQRNLQEIALRCYHHNKTYMPRAVKKELKEILGIEDT